jgi:hypothetical protein
MNKIIITTILFTSVLFAMGGQDRADRQPPQEAISICEGQSEGSTCTLNTPRGEMSGTCSTTPDGKYFACKPNHRGGNDRPQR